MSESAREWRGEDSCSRLPVRHFGTELEADPSSFEEEAARARRRARECKLAEEIAAAGELASKVSCAACLLDGDWRNGAIVLVGGAQAVGAACAAANAALAASGAAASLPRCASVAVAALRSTLTGGERPPLAPALLAAGAAAFAKAPHACARVFPSSLKAVSRLFFLLLFFFFSLERGVRRALVTKNARLSNSRPTRRPPPTAARLPTRTAPPRLQRSRRST